MPLDLDLDHAPESATRARRAVRVYVEEEWPESLDDAILRDLVDDIELVTAELIANSVRHGATPVSLHVATAADDGCRSVTLVARDGGEWDETDSDPDGGRGLLLVRALSARLDVERGGLGTTVRVRLERPWPPGRPR
ncbi:MAG: ATP-binding protein [Candidatus Nanopelagicales bacterium]